MSLLSWLKNSPQPKTPGLPNPRESKTEIEAETIVAANTSVDKLTSEENPKKRKRGEYQNYDENVRAKIAVYAIEKGVMKATRKFSTELNKKLSESTVRSMKKAFLKEQTRTGATPRQLVKAQRGQ
ncbi:uncharacterized protein LOC121379845 [Gigantopelta aegis]|uniref:uncharacterized protein LOC121379845 n=1 Tax=Gigantopelta aegis TaxID=1735272 RepID=UPI001B88B370|nr:uncharacterized protein LOC121379845 [Gigantopelta aegis]